jgi:hypothetical protein
MNASVCEGPLGRSETVEMDEREQSAPALARVPVPRESGSERRRPGQGSLSLLEARIVSGTAGELSAMDESLGSAGFLDELIRVDGWATVGNRTPGNSRKRKAHRRPAIPAMTRGTAISRSGPQPPRPPHNP